MAQMIIFIFASIFTFCLILTVILLGLISYTFIYDKIMDIYYEIKNRSKEKKI